MRDWWHRLRRRAHRFLRRTVGQDPPSRLARGVSAGAFAAAFPLPGLQIPLSLLLAWVVRGNKLVAVLPQFAANALTLLPLAWLEYRLGAWLWLAQARATQEAVGHVDRLLDSWAWTAPLASWREMLHILGRMGLHSLGPLMLGAVIIGLIAALVSYPATVVLVYAWRQQHHRRSAARKRRGPLALPEPPADLRLEDCLATHVSPQTRFVAADSVRLLVDGREAFPEMLDAIRSAQSSICLETYILRDDPTGREFGASLAQAAQRGAQVRLLYDYIGSFGLPRAYVTGLLDAGAQVAVFNPLTWRRPPWALNRRDHRKLLIVDERVGFTGGINLAHEYAGRYRGGSGWRDTHIRLNGAAPAAAMRKLFEYGWERGVPYPQTLTPAARLGATVRRTLARRFTVGSEWLAGAPPQLPPDKVAVALIGNQEFHYRRRIRQAYLRAIHAAQRYILIENAYFIPDRGVRRALARAAQRGVIVAVVLAEHSDVRMADLASRSLFSELLASGVRIFQWPRGVMHAKTAVIDDVWSLVGSYNIDHRSLRHSLEDVAVVMDFAVAARLRDQTMQDIALCREATLREHEARAWRQMLMESAAYSLRAWL